MNKLMSILENELKIIKGNKKMKTISKNVFIEKVWNVLFNDYLYGSITGTITNSMASTHYDAESICMSRQDYNSFNIRIERKGNNDIFINLEKVEIINISISENNWIDLHLLTTQDDNNYNDYVSIVISPY